MFILKTSEDDFYRYIYWTLDGEHIFRVQKTPKKNTAGNTNKERKK